jgi:hypothetical protein
MPQAADITTTVPAWVLRPLPINAVWDVQFIEEIDKLGARLPESIFSLMQALRREQATRAYDAALNRACAHVWRAVPQLLAADESQRSLLAQFAQQCLPPRARLRIFRRLAKDRSAKIRRALRKVASRDSVREVTLANSDPQAAAAAAPRGEWAGGWFHGYSTDRIVRPRPVSPGLAANLPPLPNVRAVRELLRINSRQQLGWLLLATDEGGGPYTTFSIPKRSGASRQICAPKWQLRLVQQRILRNILDKVPAHPAAHGFVRGRSTLSNAQPHVGASVVVKFDLEDFFPTIYYFRVVGLFASLGYGVISGRFTSDDHSHELAPLLARLCTYSPDPKAFGAGHLPQGAPTSPAISNLVCRRLDARLAGLAERNGGAYTRYADDLTFSFREAVPDLGRFRWWVDQVCHQEGFFVNQAKFRVIRRSQRQAVTGIVVNEAARVPRRDQRRFRAMLHQCRTQGLEAAARGRPGFRGYLRGFASYLAMVQPAEGRDLLRQVHQLLGEAGGPP